MALSFDELEKYGDEILAGRTPAKKRTKWDDLEDQGDTILGATPPLAPVPVVTAPAPMSEADPLYSRLYGETEAWRATPPDVPRIVGAMDEGWRKPDPGMTPEQEAQQTRLWGPYLGGGVNLFYRGADALLRRAPNALMYGGAELANQVTGDPRAGRDALMMAQILPFAHVGTGVPPVETSSGLTLNPLLGTFDRAEGWRAEQAPRFDPAASNIARFQTQIGVRPEPPPSGPLPADTAPPGVPPGTEVPNVLRLRAAIGAAGEAPADFVPGTSRVPPGAAGPATVPYAPERVAPLEPPGRGGPRVGEVPPAEDAHGTVNTAGDVHAGEAPSPRSGGAAATPDEAIPDQTRVERARNLRVSINESARDRAGPELTDDTTYVPNIPPRMRPERDFNPQTALDHKYSYGEDASGYRADYDANHTARNQGMRDLLEHDAGDGITLDQLRKTRREVAPDQFGAFEGEQPVDASGLQTRIQRLLDSPEGKRGAVERTLKNVLDSLHDREGNLETMPSRLYGVRKHIDDLIEKARKPTDREGTDAAAAVHILRDLAPVTDDLIQSGAGRYQAYRDAYREASQPVNRQRFLQQYQGGTKKLWDKDGNLQLQPLNRMLEDIHKGLADTKFNLAQSLTDAQIQNIINVRNELAARSLRDTQAALPGSPTAQLLNQAAKRGTGPLAKTLKNVGELAAHGAAAYVEGGPSLLNAPIAAYTVTRHLREARKAARTQAKVEAQTNALKQRLLSQEPVNPLSLYDQ